MTTTHDYEHDPIVREDLTRILDQTEDLHRSLDHTRVLVTGGSGFFGRWLLDSWIDATTLLGLNRTAVVVCRTPEVFRKAAPHLADHRSVELVRGDVLHASPVSGAFDGCIHAATAASLSLTRAEPRTMFDTIVAGTSNVLEWLGPSGSVPLLFTSSGAVYGAQGADVYGVTEAARSGPNPAEVVSVYAEAKRAAEMLLAISAAAGASPKIARCFAFVGPHLPIDAHFAIGNFVRDAIAGKAIVVQGDGTPVRSYLYASDLVVWLWTILVRGEVLRPYNVGSDEAIDIRETAELVGSVAGVPVEVRGSAVPGAPAARYVPNVDRAADELGLRVTVPLVDAVRRTIEWHRLDRRERPGT